MHDPFVPDNSRLVLLNDIDLYMNLVENSIFEALYCRVNVPFTLQRLVFPAPANTVQCSFGPAYIVITIWSLELLQFMEYDCIV